MIRFADAGESGDNTKKTSFCSFWLLKASFLPDKVKTEKITKNTCKILAKIKLNKILNIIPFDDKIYWRK